jgi:hypothetical protein
MKKILSILQEAGPLLTGGSLLKSKPSASYALPAENIQEELRKRLFASLANPTESLDPVALTELKVLLLEKAKPFFESQTGRLKAKLQAIETNVLHYPIFMFEPQKGRLILRNTDHVFPADIEFPEEVSENNYEYAMCIENALSAINRDVYEFYLEKARLIKADRALNITQGIVFAVTEGVDKKDGCAEKLLNQMIKDLCTKTIHDAKLDCMYESYDPTVPLDETTVSPAMKYVDINYIYDIFDFISFIGNIQRFIKTLEANEQADKDIHALKKDLNKFLSVAQKTVDKLFNYFKEYVSVSKLPFPGFSIYTVRKTEEITRYLNKNNFKESFMLGILHVSPPDPKDDRIHYIVSCSGGGERLLKIKEHVERLQEQKRAARELLRIKGERLYAPEEVIHWVAEDQDTFHFQDVPNIRKQKRDYVVINHNGHGCAQYPLWRLLNELQETDPRWKAISMQETYYDIEGRDAGYQMSRPGSAQVDAFNAYSDYQLLILNRDKIGYEIDVKKLESDRGKLEERLKIFLELIKIRSSQKYIEEYIHEIVEAIALLDSDLLELQEKIQKANECIKLINQEVRSGPKTPFIDFSAPCPGCKMNAATMFEWRKQEEPHMPLDRKYEALAFSPKRFVHNEGRVLTTPPRTTQQRVQSRFSIYTNSPDREAIAGHKSEIDQLNARLHEISPSRYTPSKKYTPSKVQRRRALYLERRFQEKSIEAEASPYKPMRKRFDVRKPLWPVSPSSRTSADTFFDSESMLDDLSEELYPPLTHLDDSFEENFPRTRFGRRLDLEDFLNATSPRMIAHPESPLDDSFVSDFPHQSPLLPFPDLDEESEASLNISSDPED